MSLIKNHGREPWERLSEARARRKNYLFPSFVAFPFASASLIAGSSLP